MHVMLEINFTLYCIFYAVSCYYEIDQLEKQSLIFPNFLHRGYNKVNTLITI